MVDTVAASAADFGGPVAAPDRRPHPKGGLHGRIVVHVGEFSLVRNHMHVDCGAVGLTNSHTANLTVLLLPSNGLYSCPRAKGCPAKISGAELVADERAYGLSAWPQTNLGKATELLRQAVAEISVSDQGALRVLFAGGLACWCRSMTSGQHGQ
ncbi:hypothetical protein [Streptomyces sp. CB02009]|uniref:hypothetical protein n=1 Tax=Streptomyces sp. CB02009 TaxID=1703938 RepID=UPI000A8CC1B7|nr:hypothetical protein [Streptomyces sp. CB02009]